jgi:hypothetical protein
MKAKKVKLENDVGDSFTNYFEMKGSPPMTHAIIGGKPFISK